MRKGVVLLGSLVIIGLISTCGGMKVVKQKPINFSLDDKVAGMLSPNELFEVMAIEVPAKNVVQYVFGDNIAGYLEGYTHAYKRGQGYIMVSSSTFSDFASYTAGEINNKKSAKSAKIYPYGVRTIYSGGSWDEFIMHNKKYALTLIVHSDKPESLSLLPLLNLRQKTTVVEQVSNITVLSPEKEMKKRPSYPVYVAISSAQPYTLEIGDREKRPELSKVVKASKNLISPIFTAVNATNQFEIHIAFGFTKKEAMDKAADMMSKHCVALEKKECYDFLTKSYFWTDDIEYNRALMWAKLSAYFMVTDEFGKGIWAGLPWFKNNWGRDTFISLPGTLLVSGQFDEALAVMTNFSTYQDKGQLSLEISYDNDETKKAVREYVRKNLGKKIAYKDNKIYYSLERDYVGRQDLLDKLVKDIEKSVPGAKAGYELVIGKTFGRVPNRVAGRDNIIYNTTDGTPWFMREMYEYLRYTGDMAFTKEIYPVLKLALDGAIRNFVDDKGFLTHDDADTWMDARIAGNEPWSARGNRANDIQVLWYTSLRTGALMAQFNNDTGSAKQWNAIADNLKKNYSKLFWNPATKMMADRVTAKDRPDYKPRPNQLMLISVPFEDRFIDNTEEAYVVKNAVSELLYPYGIASLSQNHPYFHPYHDNRPDYHKDAAYHNGTVWGWNAGFTVTAMTRYGYTDMAYELEKNLGHQILYQGCRGSMSEVMDAIQTDYNNLKLTGTYSQAWSVAEYARNGYQDFAGFRPNLLEDIVYLIPAMPEAWKKFDARLAFGAQGKAKFLVAYRREGNEMEFDISYTGYDKPLTVVFAPLAADKTRYRIDLPLKPGEKKTVKFNFATGAAIMDGAPVAKKVYLESQEKIIGKLKFQTPAVDKKYPALQEKNYLEKIIKSGKFE